MSLSDLKENEKAKIVKIQGGIGIIQRLMDLGLTYGTVVQIIRNFGRGPIIVSVRNTDIALGRGIARKIWVEKI
jgi:ferrous iron transport protein A